MRIIKNPQLAMVNISVRQGIGPVKVCVGIVIPPKSRIFMRSSSKNGPIIVPLFPGIASKSTNFDKWSLRRLPSQSPDQAFVTAKPGPLPLGT